LFSARGTQLNDTFSAKACMYVCMYVCLAWPFLAHPTFRARSYDLVT
jgi:hypothetical protein